MSERTPTMNENSRLMAELALGVPGPTTCYLLLAGRY